MDPTITRADRLVGQVLGQVGALPDVFTEVEINFFLLRRLLGVKTQVTSLHFHVDPVAQCILCFRSWRHRWRDFHHRVDPVFAERISLPNTKVKHQQIAEGSSSSSHKKTNVLTKHQAQISARLNGSESSSVAWRMNYRITSHYSNQDYSVEELSFLEYQAVCFSCPAISLHCSQCTARVGASHREIKSYGLDL